MTERSIFTRLSVKDAEKAAADMERFGKRGSAALQKVERASKPASRGLLAVDRAAQATQGGMRNLATSFAIFEGPLGSVSGRINALGGALGRINPLVLGLAAAAAVTIGTFSKSATAGAQYERFLLRTEQQLTATRYASGLTRQELDRFTFSLAQNTLASTEGARKAAAELLTFRAVSGDTFKETLTLAQDLAASGIGALETNVLQLGKALQDPVKGLTALSRAGVQFTDQQKDQIKAMVEAGNTAAAQAAILEELRNQVGGAGTAEAGGLSGAYDTLTENLGRFFEKVGDKSGVVDTLTDSMRGLADVVEDLTPDTSTLAELARVEAQIAATRANVLPDFRPGSVLPDNPALRAAQAPAQRERLAGLDALLEKRRELRLELSAEKREREEAAVAAQIAARKAAEQAEASRLAAEAEKARAKAEKERNRERAQALSEIERLEEQAALAGLEGVEKLEVERDRALAEFEVRLEKQTIKEEEFARARLAIEEKFQKEKEELEEDARERREKEEERERDKREREEERARDKAQREAEREAERAAERQARPFINAAERIQQGFSDAFTEILEGGKFKMEDLADSVKSIFARLFAELATLAILKPIVVPVVGALAGGLGLGSGAVGQITGNLGGGFGGGAGFLGNIFSPNTDIFGGGSIFDVFNSFGANLGFAPSAGLGGLPAGAGPLNNIVGSGGLFGSTTFSQFLGGAGLGFGAGSLANSLLGRFIGGGNQLGGTVGSGIGALGGAAIGSIFPGVGTILGGLLGGVGGGLLGGLFGNDGKTVGPNANAVFTVRDGRLVLKKAQADNGGDVAGARALGNDVIRQVNALLDSLGADLTRRGIGAVGNFPSQGGLFINTSQRLGQGGNQFLGKDYQGTVAAAVLAAFENGNITGLDPALAAAVTRAAGISEDLQDFAANIGVAKAILDDSLFDDEEITQAEQAIKALNEQFEEAAERAERLGLSVAKVEELREKALTALTEGFDESIRLQILAFTDPLSAAFEQLEAQQAARLAEAEVLGADLVELERLNGLERQRVIEQASAGALSSLKAFRDEITFGGLSGASPTESAAGARAAFEAAAAQAAAGSATALGEISSLGRGLIELSRTAFASSSGFQDDLARVREVVEALLGDVPGFAAGVGSAPRGFAVVGERGAELVRLSGGEQIYPAEVTDQIGIEALRGNDELAGLLRQAVTLLSQLAAETRAARLDQQRRRAAA